METIQVATEPRRRVVEQGLPSVAAVSAIALIALVLGIRVFVWVDTAREGDNSILAMVPWLAYPGIVASIAVRSRVELLATGFAAVVPVAVFGLLYRSGGMENVGLGVLLGYANPDPDQRSGGVSVGAAAGLVGIDRGNRRRGWDLPAGVGHRLLRALASELLRRMGILTRIMRTKVGERGQVTIKKAIREELAINAGDVAIQRVEDGRIVIDIVPGRHRLSLAGSLRDKIGRSPTDELWDVLRDAAWRAPNPDRMR